MVLEKAPPPLSPPFFFLTSLSAQARLKESSNLSLSFLEEMAGYQLLSHIYHVMALSRPVPKGLRGSQEGTSLFQHAGHVAFSGHCLHSKWARRHNEGVAISL